MTDFGTTNRYPAATEKHQPEIEQQLIEMHSAVNILEDVTKNISDRLSTVMRPPIPANNEKSAKLSTSKMGQELNALTSQIISCQSIIIDIMNRLEI